MIHCNSRTNTVISNGLYWNNSSQVKIAAKAITTSHLDRDKAIFKIQELRVIDENVAAVTAVKLAQFSVPFSQAPNENIVSELKMQIDILSAELAKELSEQ